MTAQVGIGTETPNATLEIKSTNEATPAINDGLLIPKVEEFPLTNPGAGQDGMLVYATGAGTISKGFYYWDHGTTAWVQATGAKSINELNDGKSDNDGSNNGSSIFFGINSGQNDDVSDNQNVGIGANSLSSNTSGYDNTGIGYSTLLDNNTGYQNTAVGHSALESNTTGYSNTAVGSLALEANSTGISNTALGRRAMEFKTGGNNNTAIGTLALRANTTGNINTIVGSAAGFNVEGDGNVIIGVGRTLSGTRTISNSVFIGKYAGNPETNSDRLYIENSESATPLIYGEFDNDVLGFNADVGINTQSPSASLHVNHQNGSSTEGFVISNVIDADEWRMYMQWNSNTLSMFFNNTNVGNFDDVSGTYSAVSDRRLKKNIEPLGTVLEKVNQLEVVDYNFIHQQESKKYTGLIAQEVEVLFPNLVVPPNEESENYTMDYSAFGVIAIKAIQEQQEEIDHLKKELEQLRNFIKSWQNE